MDRRLAQHFIFILVRVFRMKERGLKTNDVPKWQPTEYIGCVCVCVLGVTRVCLLPADSILSHGHTAGPASIPAQVVGVSALIYTCNSQALCDLRHVVRRRCSIMQRHTHVFSYKSGSRSIAKVLPKKRLARLSAIADSTHNSSRWGIMES